MLVSLYSLVYLGIYTRRRTSVLGGLRLWFPGEGGFTIAYRRCLTLGPCRIFFGSGR